MGAGVFECGCALERFYMHSTLTDGEEAEGATHEGAIRRDVVEPRVEQHAPADEHLDASAAVVVSSKCIDRFRVRKSPFSPSLFEAYACILHDVPPLRLHTSHVAQRPAHP